MADQGCVWLQPQVPARGRRPAYGLCAAHPLCQRYK